MTAARIGKITCKKTGRSMRVITPSFKSVEHVGEMLKDGLNFARHKKITAIAMILYDEEGEEYFSDFYGDYNTIQAGVSLLSYRVSKTWDKQGREL